MRKYMGTATRPDKLSPNPWTHMVDSTSSFNLCSDFHTGIVACMHTCLCVCMSMCICNKLSVIHVRCMWPMRRDSCCFHLPVERIQRLSRWLFLWCANGGTRLCIRRNGTEWALEEGEQRLLLVEQPKQRADVLIRQGQGTSSTI